MFSRVHTRVLLVLSLLITAGLSFIGLNWETEPEEEREVKHLLEVPEIKTAGVSARSKEPSFEEDEKGKEKDFKEEKDEESGRTIDLY